MPFYPSSARARGYSRSSAQPQEPHSRFACRMAWMGAARSPAPILEPFEKEHIGGIRIRTTEACSAGRLAWKRAAVAQDIGVQKRACMASGRCTHVRRQNQSCRPAGGRLCGHGDAGTGTPRGVIPPRRNGGFRPRRFPERPSRGSRYRWSSWRSRRGWCRAGHPRFGWDPSGCASPG